MMSDYKVEMINDGMQEFYLEFHGPKDSNNPLLFPNFLLVILSFSFVFIPFLIVN